MSGPIPAKKGAHVLAANGGCENRGRDYGHCEHPPVWFCGGKAKGSTPFCDDTHNRL